MGSASVTGSFQQDKSKSRTEYEKEQTLTQKKDSTSTTKTDSATDVVGKVTSLGAETIGDLESLVKNLMEGTLSSEAVSGSAKELAQFLSARAKGGGEEQKAQSAAIIGEARRKGELQISKLQQELARQSGGSIANTLVASSTGEAAVSLESQLADVQARLGITARQAETEELAQAFNSLLGGEQAGAQNLSSLLGILKGAQVDTSQRSTTTSTSVTELSELLESLTKEKGATSTSSKAQSTKLSGTGSN